jgi:hypothetical protein
VWGFPNSNECPDGSYRITEEAQCIRAAAAAKKMYDSIHEEPSLPRGCSLTSNIDDERPDSHSAYSWDLSRRRTQ